MRGLIILFSICLSTTGLFAQDGTALLDQLRAKMDKVQDYKADASLIVDVPFLKIPARQVVIYFNRPDQFIIENQSGISITPKAGVNTNLYSFLQSNEFTAILGGETTWQGQKLRVLKLLPLSDKSEVVVSTLYIDESHALVRKISNTTRENGTYELELNYGKLQNWGLPDKVTVSFNTRDFKLPKGLAFDYEEGNTAADKPTTAAKDQTGKVIISYSRYLINKGLGRKKK